MSSPRQKVVRGSVHASGKPHQEVHVAYISMSRIKKIPDGFQWASFLHANRVITVGAFSGIREVWEARVKGLWC